MEMDLDPSRLCRDDRCERTEVHLAHAITHAPPAPKTLTKSVKEPWRRRDPRALDHCIAKAVSQTYPRHIAAIVEEVRQDYGACNLRTVQRHLQRLVQRGHLLRIDIGRSLYAYLRPGSSMAHERALMLTQIEDLILDMQSDRA
jgi:hypothetical protein